MTRTSAVELSHRSADQTDNKPGFDELLGLVNYNQGLVEFADSKAGSLILLNSLLIAAVTALPNSGNVGLLKMISVLVASAAVFFCFQVITSRAGSPDEAGLVVKKKSTGWQNDDFIFFDSVTAHKSGEDYCRAFGHSDPDARRRALLQRTYIIAGIAKRKFSQYALAQKVTTAAMAVWVAVNVLPFLVSSTGALR
jgi:hypothetical protein